MNKYVKLKRQEYKKNPSSKLREEFIKIFMESGKPDWGGLKFNGIRIN